MNSPQVYRGFVIGPVKLGVTYTQWYAEVTFPGAKNWFGGLGYPLSIDSRGNRWAMVFAHCKSRRRAEKKIKRQIDKTIRKFR